MAKCGAADKKHHTKLGYVVYSLLSLELCSSLYVSLARHELYLPGETHTHKQRIGVYSGAASMFQLSNYVHPYTLL